MLGVFTSILTVAIVLKGYFHIAEYALDRIEKHEWQLAEYYMTGIKPGTQKAKLVRIK